jgi:hypothetical protein
MENQEIKQPTKNEAREQLKTLSNQLKPLVKAGEFNTVNEALIEVAYKSPEHQEFKKFWDWKKEGYTILKGSKAFPIWAQPIKGKKKEAIEEGAEFEFFPICFLFSNSQVRRLENGL